MARQTDPVRTRERRAAIRDAAVTLFATTGFERTTAADIARAAGISAGSVFYWFPDKRAVFREIFSHDLAESREIVARHVDRTDATAAVLDVVAELGAPARDPIAAGLTVELIRQVGNDPELAAVVDESVRLVRAALATLVRRGQAAGTIAADLDPVEAARCVQACVDGAFLDADPERDPVPMLRRIVAAFLTSTPTDSDTTGDDH